MNSVELLILLFVKFATFKVNPELELNVVEPLTLMLPAVATCAKIIVYKPPTSVLSPLRLMIGFVAVKVLVEPVTLIKLTFVTLLVTSTLMLVPN